MKLIGAALVLAVGLAGCVSQPPSKAPDVFSQLVGAWDEVHENSCKNAHVLRFDDKRTMMLLTYRDVGWVTETDSRKVFRYKVLSTSRSSLRVQLEREPRLDDHGNPVVWHITPIDGDTYCWGRDDWPQGACTPPRKRCGI
jgi:hypothetical protein